MEEEGGGMPPGGVGMWPDPTMGRWVGEEQSSYGDDEASRQQYCEGSHGKGRAPDKDQPGASDRRNEWEEEMGHAPEWSEMSYWQLGWA